tara:strand:+ start:12759 stop:13193 length:435 start_codon:yes stop_codon:yes gene_type:complete
MKYYFAYGSNMDENQMMVRCPDSELVGKGVLKGYRIGFSAFSNTWGGGVADVVQEEGSEVWGVVYSITGKDLKRLDRYEGFPNYYGRFEGKILLGRRKVIAFVYEVVNKEDFVEPSDEYRRVMIDAVRKFGFPEGYLEGLKRKS